MISSPKNQDTYKNGSTKIEHYKWTLVGQRGVYMDIPKRDIRIDDAYQRDASNHNVLRIASEWSWVSCSAIVVAQREDGSFWAIDGQHRVLAALRRADIDTLPCLVFKMADISEEARNFSRLNTSRRPPMGHEIHKSNVVAKDHLAMVVEELVLQSGRRVGRASDKYTVVCVTKISKLARQNEPALRRVWPVIVDLCRGHSIKDRVVEALVYMEARMPEGQSLSDKRWRERLLDVGYEQVCDSMTRMSAAFSRGGARVWAMGVLQAINKGLRSRLSISGLNDTPQDL